MRRLISKHFKGILKMRRLFPCSICLLSLFSLVCATQTDGYSVEVPVNLVSGLVGDTVTLPCLLSPLGDAVKMEVRWFKDKIEAPLYFYTLQNAVSSVQPDEYRDRAHIFIEELSVGNLSLHLSNIQTSDSGRYICSVIHKTKYAQAVVELKVIDGYSVEVPVDLVSGLVGDTVTLPCLLSPLGDAVKMEVRWFKDGIEAPVYFYTLQNPVSSTQPDGYRDRAHIFIEELRVGNLSLQLSNIQTSDSGRYNCSVSHKMKSAQAVVDLKVTGDAKSPSWLIVLPWFVIPIFIAIVAYCLSTKCRKAVKQTTKRQDQTVNRDILCSDAVKKTTKPRGPTRNNDSLLFSDAVKKTTKPRGPTRNNDSLLFSDDEETDVRYQPAGTSRSSIQNTRVKASHRTAAVIGRKNPRDHTRNNDGPFSDDEDSTSPKPKGSGEIPKQLVKAGFLQRILSWMGTNSSKAPVSADVTLDPETASPSLFLSEDHKEVRLGTEEWEYDRTLMKQKKWYSVLGTEGFASGRHYWEVEVGEKQNWRLGVGEKSSGGTEPLNWTLGLRKGEFENDLGNHSSPSELRIVRVSLDMVGRQLSFFNAETSSEIHTVSVAKATGKLYPYFSPGGWDRDPLLIFDLNPEKLIKNNRISQSEIS